MEKKYRKIICIDLGSTNSQIAQRYEVSSDGGKTWQSVPKKDGIFSYFLRTDGDINYPTVLICKDELSPEQVERINVDDEVIFGKEAVKIHDSYYQIPLLAEFKKDLYYSAEEKRKDPKKQKLFQKAEKYTKLFLKNLKKRELREPDYNCEEETTYVTVPIRATFEYRELMKRWAEEAGWKNVDIHNEIEGIVQYALYSGEQFSLYQKLGNLTVLQKLRLLVVDIGGSTADVVLVELSPDGQGGYEAHEVDAWPKFGESETLGGIDVDKKICQWFLDSGYIIPELTEENIKRNGYRAFRMFKETTSSLLRKGANNGTIDQLPGGDILNLAMNLKRQQFASNNYDESTSKKIDRDVYINDIFSEYAIKLQQAVRTLLEKCKCSEGDIDGIILAGGGSQMYGVEELFRGELAVEGNPFNFTKITQDPYALVLMKENSSGLCALGNVLPKSSIPYKKHCLYNYKLEVELYTAEAGTLGSWKRSFLGEPEIPERFMKVYSKYWILAQQHQMLPVNVRCSDNEYIYIKHGHAIIYVAKVYSEDDKGRHFQYAWSSFSRRNPFTFIKDTFSSNDSYMPGKININVTIGENLLMKLLPEIKVEGYFGFSGNTQTTNANG